MDTVKIKAPFVIDAFGDLIFFDETIDYYPYGETRLDNKAGAYDERHKYTGYEFDATTGLNYAGARYQTAKYGRFISEDPAFWTLSPEMLMDPQQMNSYSYARNNPIRNTDPTGMSSNSIVDNVKKALNTFASSVTSYLNGGNTQQIATQTSTTTSANAPDPGTTLVNYQGSNFLNSTNKIPIDFAEDLSRVNEYAGENGVQVYAESSGIRIKGAPIPGDIYHKPGEVTENSLHYIGVAIDIKVQYLNSNAENSMCDNSCLKSGFSNLPNPVQGFIGDIRNDGELRWGGDFSRVDAVHIDNNLYQRDPGEYFRRFNILQNL